MITLFKDRYKLGLLMAGLFFAGIFISLYTIYSVPHELMIPDGYQSVFVGVYFILGLTFITGSISIFYALQHKNEVIVYRDRQLERATAERESSQSNQTTISLENIKNVLKQAKGEKEALQNGLQEICRQLDAGLGAIYLTKQSDSGRKVVLQAGYALSLGENTVISFEFGEGLVGQAAAGGKTFYLDDVPEGYIKILSGLGSASPQYLLIVPVKKDEEVLGIIELASFIDIIEDQRKFIEESAALIAQAITRN